MQKQNLFFFKGLEFSKNRPINYFQKRFLYRIDSIQKRKFVAILFSQQNRPDTIICK